MEITHKISKYFDIYTLQMGYIFSHNINTGSIAYCQVIGCFITEGNWYSYEDMFNLYEVISYVDNNQNMTIQCNNIPFGTELKKVVYKIIDSDS